VALILKVFPLYYEYNRLRLGQAVFEELPSLVLALFTLRMMEKIYGEPEVRELTEENTSTKKRKPPSCYVYYKSHMYCPGNESGSQRRNAID
jgi:hypothetical protein